MPKIAVTGSSGTVGKAILPGLAKEHEIVPIDLPDIDVLDTEALAHRLSGVYALIHLASIFGPAEEGMENWRSPHKYPVNNQLLRSALSAAIKARVKLFIHASSIHVEDSLGHMLSDPGRLLEAQPRSFLTAIASGYGKSKREQEALVEADAKKFDPGAVSLRLGGVTESGLPLSQHEDSSVLKHERKVWLDHSELGDLILRIIDQKDTLDYDVVYAVSANEGSFHDTSNRYGWKPGANSAGYHADK